MNKEIFEYCKSLGMADPFIARVSNAIQMHETCAPEPFTDVFINEYVKEDGSRAFESVWFISKNFAFEAKNFIAEDIFDCAPIKVTYWELKKRDFDFDKASPQSRMNLKVNVTDHTEFQFKASGDNCLNLMRIFLSHFKTRISKA